MADDRPPSHAALPAENRTSTPVAARVLSSGELLQGRMEVLIEHGCQTYRLRLMRSGKLILQK